jgi:hypothetical protein
MNSGLITGLIAGPNRLSKAVLSRKQAIPGAEITQALANVGIARVSLSAAVTRTSATGTTMTNTGLQALTVSLLPSSRYRMTYRLYVSGNPGFKLGLTFPSSLPQFDGTLNSYNTSSGYDVAVYADWANQAYGSGDTIVEGTSSIPQVGGLIFTADITTGSTANTYGDFAVIFGQSSSDATATTMSQNSCVEVLKFS